VEEALSTLGRVSMPYWSSEDTKNALLASLIPGGTALAGGAVYLADKPTIEWWEKLRKPEWITAKRAKVMCAVDVMAAAPVGYASYLCYKHGGGFDYNDTRLALALYGMNMALVATCIPLIKKRNLNCLSRNLFFVHGTAVAAAIAFFKIHKPAGYWMIPYALWTGFYLYMVHAVKKENDPVKDI